MSRRSIDPSPSYPVCALRGLDAAFISINRTALRLNGALAVRPITIPQLGALLQVARGRDELRLIAKNTGLAKPDVFRAVNALEFAGLVDRHDNPADLRSPKVRLTNGGRTFLDMLTQDYAVAYALFGHINASAKSESPAPDPAPP